MGFVAIEGSRVPVSGEYRWEVSNVGWYTFVTDAFDTRLGGFGIEVARVLWRLLAVSGTIGAFRPDFTQYPHYSSRIRTEAGGRRHGRTAIAST